MSYSAQEFAAIQSEVQAKARAEQRAAEEAARTLAEEKAKKKAAEADAALCASVRPVDIVSHIKLNPLGKLPARLRAATSGAKVLHVTH